MAEDEGTFHKLLDGCNGGLTPLMFTGGELVMAVQGRHRVQGVDVG